jgi:hypothetical protein
VLKGVEMEAFLVYFGYHTILVLDNLGQWRIKVVVVIHKIVFYKVKIVLKRQKTLFDTTMTNIVLLMPNALELILKNHHPLLLHPLSIGGAIMNRNGELVIAIFSRSFSHMLEIPLKDRFWLILLRGLFLFCYSPTAHYL